MQASPERYGIRPGDPSTTEREGALDGPRPWAHPSPCVARVPRGSPGNSAKTAMPGAAAARPDRSSWPSNFGD